MKEIKFRFWDLNSKKWAENMGLYQDGQIGDFSECFHNDAGKNGEHYIAQQYTGLKDRKEKEIYEGDIIRYSSWKCVVDYNTRQGYLANSIDENLSWDLWYVLSECEVIGNIFENPELC